MSKPNPEYVDTLELLERIAAAAKGYNSERVSFLTIPRTITGAPLASATSFLYTVDGKLFLVSNWHVFAGRDPVTHEILSNTAATPVSLTVHIPMPDRVTWKPIDFCLSNDDGSSIWLELSDAQGTTQDIAALPINEHTSPKSTIFDLAHSNITPLRYEEKVLSYLPIGVTTALSVVGFPRGRTAGGQAPIWNRAHVASDPALDYEGNPVFLIDAPTTSGQSGAPVVFFLSDLAQLIPGATAQLRRTFAPVCAVIGVYAGRIDDRLTIGRVCRVETLVQLTREGTPSRVNM